MFESDPAVCHPATHLLPHGVEVVLQVAVLAEDGGPLAPLLVTDPVAVVELGLQVAAELLKLRHLRLGLLHL